MGPVSSPGSRGTSYHDVPRTCSTASWKTAALGEHFQRACVPSPRWIQMRKPLSRSEGPLLGSSAGWRFLQDFRILHSYTKFSVSLEFPKDMGSVVTHLASPPHLTKLQSIYCLCTHAELGFPQFSEHISVLSVMSSIIQG